MIKQNRRSRSAENEREMAPGRRISQNLDFAANWLPQAHAIVPHQKPRDKQGGHLPARRQLMQQAMA